MQLKFLGTGTSQGVPVIGCQCEVCQSTDPRDNRLRSSALLTTDHGKNILIDCGPDFRQQMLRIDAHAVDAVLLTHEHNDHVIGLDDLRPVIFSQDRAANIYGLTRVLQQVEERFPYAFAKEKYPGAPTFHLYPVDAEFELFGINIEPIDILHYRLPILGYRFGNLAYITDASHLSEEVKKSLRGMDHLIINCLRREPGHISHFILPEVVQLQKEIQPGMMYLTHINHEFGKYSEENPKLPPGMQMAYDGLEIIF